ncbi:hypothetical protein GCM10023190_00070 [Enteractinococcus fodinae]|uniref:Uncharacterized protein YndB with AHSA1/START domain n=1 Tax=Enteractinococcus fodinae TaxID=684663 RepID=A0ABU2B1P5_9MICC|nr:DUF2505 domain-containing protein [Enteractinococcus fodinae]MDR7347515.1 uncharacterized protein YndB with AHSA1/START domain [Enteractinococcus fodinae]
MAFNESTTISHPPQRVFEGLISQDFQQHVAEEFNASVDKFTVVPPQPAASDTVSVTIHRSVNGEQVAQRLPSAVQRFVKGRVNIEQSEAWSAASGDGARDANVTIKVPMAKATGTATIKLAPTADGTGTTVNVSGSLKSSIPLMGSKIAQMAEPQVGKMLTEMNKKLDAWLTQH